MRSFRFAIAMLFCLTILGCASTIIRGRIGNEYVKAYDSSSSMWLDWQTLRFRPGDKICLFAEVKPGNRFEWYYNGNPYSARSYIEMEFPYPQKSVLKLYAYGLLPETSIVPIDSTGCYFEITK